MLSYRANSPLIIPRLERTGKIVSPVDSFKNGEYNFFLRLQSTLHYYTKFDFRYRNKWTKKKGIFTKLPM